MRGGATQASGVGKSSVFYSAVDPACYRNDLPGKLSPLIQQRHACYGSNHHFWFNVKPTSQEGIHSWYCKPGQKPKVRKVMGPRGGYTTVLLNGCGIELPSEYLCLDPWLGI